MDQGLTIEKLQGLTDRVEADMNRPYIPPAYPVSLEQYHVLMAYVAGTNDAAARLAKFRLNMASSDEPRPADDNEAEIEVPDDLTAPTVDG